MFYNPAVLNRD